MIIYCDFVNKKWSYTKLELPRPKKPSKLKKKVLTKGELSNYEQRIYEIEKAIDLCDSDRDADVLDNLDKELNEIEKILKKSLKKQVKK